MSKLFTFFIAWCVCFGSIALVRFCTLPTGYASTSAVLDVSVINNNYHSCTVAVHQIQDYYFEYNSTGLINVTPVGKPIILDSYASDICLTG